MSAILNQSFESNIYLELVGVPATGVLFSDVTAKIKKPGEVTLTARLLVTAEWVELGDGFYTIKWPPEDLDVAGTFFYTLDNATLFDNFLFAEFDVIPPPLFSAVFPDKCVISGNVLDIGGSPGQGQQIRVTPVKLPAVAGSSLLVSDPIFSVPDVEGNFSVALIRNQTVIFQIERTGIRQQIDVPDSPSALLIDLLPPIT